VQEVSIDVGVLLFALGLSIATGVIFGIAPAWLASRADFDEALKEGGRSSSGGGRWVRNGLVVVEVALSLVLLVGATLFVRSFNAVTAVDPGFDPEGVLSLRVTLPQSAYPARPQRLAFFERFLDRLDALPQVASVAATQVLPMAGDYVLSFAVQGRPAEPGRRPSANYRAVTAGYFETLRIPLLRGRIFTRQDAAAGAPMLAVIDAAFARQHFPGEDPIGRGLEIGNGADGFFEIVGIVGDVHYDGLEAVADPTMYVLTSQDMFGSLAVLVRAEGDIQTVAGDVRAVLREIDPNVPAALMNALPNIVSDSLDERRFSVLLLGVFAVVALFLAAVGLYGVLSYSVSRRSQEMGVRLALGATPSHLLRLMVSHGLALTVAGALVGLACALPLTRLIETMLFGVTRFDPASYAVTAMVLVAVGAAACYVPARRAMRLDPIVALRTE
jgi:putative ABC transport system permease protein